MLEATKEKIIKQISPTSMPCFDFIDEEGNKDKKTVIIAPITIQAKNRNTIIIAWACSRAPYCYDKECRYSKHQKGTETNYKEYLADY